MGFGIRKSSTKNFSQNLVFPISLGKKEKKKKKESKKGKI